MAGKSVTKRARVDASSLRDGNNITAASQSMTAAGDADLNRVDEETVSRLRAELETATKCIEQLRREKDYEVRQVREEEQNRSSAAVKELESRLKADCRREVERARETVKSRLEADTTRLVGRYERTVKRLSNDLDRCRNELREEIEKRGMSSTTRGGFETERCRLLAEVRDLKAAKRRLEETVESAAEVDKQKTAELKRIQEACKAEVAKVSKEATAEIRKLLEELKAKDHQLALLDRNQYADRGASLSKHQTTDNASKETEPTSKPVKSVKTGEDIDSSSNDCEKLSKLEDDVEKLKIQLAASEADRTSMKFRIDELSGELAQRNEVIANLRKAGDNGQPTKQSCVTVKIAPKAVRFLLPGCTSPVLAREVELIDDDSESICSEDMSCGSSSSTSSDRWSPDTTVLYDENIEKNYQLLLTEHLNLERSISQLLSSWSPSTTASSSQASETVENQSSCTRKDCANEKDSTRMTIQALKEKHAQHEENICQLQRQLNEKNEQFEDLEFRAFELEECAEKCKLAHSSNAAEELLEKTRSLEAEMSIIKKKISYYSAIESEMGLCTGLGLREEVLRIKNELNNAENEASMSRLELVALRKTLEEVTNCHLNDVTALVNRPTMTLLDSDDMSTYAMNSSMSTTSGFDEDNSCASSVADLRLEEMPSEETWGFDFDDAYVEQNVQSSGKPCFVDEERSGSIVPEVIVLDDNGCVTGIQDYTKQQHSDSELQVQGVRKSDEKIWLARIEKVEARLTQAIQNEQRARDQAALLAEEKDRRIVALQEQVDLLEANEFRLSETIRSLERLERTFGFHLLSIESRASSTSSSKSSSSNGAADAATIVAEEEDAVNVTSPAEPDDMCFPYDDVTGVVELLRETVSENRIRFETSAMIRVSLERLKQAAAESEIVDRKIKELGDFSNETSVVRCVDFSGESTATGDECNGDWFVSAQIVDFESEYRELESLVKELKKVLVMEKEMCSGVVMKDSGTEQFNGANRPNDAVESMMADDACSGWTTGSVSYSLPGTPEFEFQSPMTGPTLDRSLQYEKIEKHLTQQIQCLEHERDVLREAVLDGESTLRELGIQLVEAQSSEQSMKDEVSRLKAKEDWMISRNNELMELVGRLEDSVKVHRAAETEMRSRCERHCAEETERGRELEDARDEHRAIETRYRRWIAQLDDEKVQLQSLVDELMEKNSDLEGREAGLQCRIRKLEAAEYGLRHEVADLERMLNEMTENRDRLLMQISEQEEVEAKSSVIQSVDGWTQSSDAESESEEGSRRLEERAEFFKEMLEFTEQSYAALESRIVDYASNESTLRSTVAEYEKIDKIWTDRCESLETDNDLMSTRIVELETTVADLKTQLRRQLDDQQIRHLANSEELRMIEGSSQMKEEPTVSSKNIVLLCEIADEMNDSESMFWEAVENAKPVEDTVDDADLSSALWSNVEARMGLTVESALKSDDQRKRPHQLSLTLIPEPPSKKADNERRSPYRAEQPPPLPLSPPPSSPGREDEDETSGETFTGIRRQESDKRRETRSLSAELLSSRSTIVSTDDENRWKRASSENRDPELQSKSAWFMRERDAEVSKAYHRMDKEWHSSSPSGATMSPARDPIMERISKSREFWSTRSLSVPCHQQNQGSDPSTNHRGTCSSNGRPSLIPRIATPLLTRPTPPVRRSVSEYGASQILSPTTTLPVIKSTPSPHLSPRLTEAELDEKKNRSFIPRPIYENRSPTAGSDSDSTDPIPETTSSKVTPNGRPRVSSKIYTTVLSPNRYVTSKFSYLSGSSQNPHAARSSVTDLKTSPTSSFATGTQHVRRPVVSSTAVGPEVRSLPGSRA